MKTNERNEKNEMKETQLNSTDVLSYSLSIQ